MKRGILFFGVFFVALIVGFFVTPNSFSEDGFETINSNLTDGNEIESVFPNVSIKPKQVEIPDVSIQLKTKRLENGEEIYWNKDYDFEFKTKLLETGEEFWSNEIKAKSGEKWLGLFKDQDSYSLRQTTIKVTKSGKGKDVSVNEKSDPLFLVKNAEDLKPKKIRTLFAARNIDDAKLLSNGFTETYELNGKTYTLRVEGGYNSSRVILESGDKRQVLYSLDKMGDTTWNLFWVGDLDNDGKLDIYADLSCSYNYVQKRLFLSSEAAKGKIVKQVAMFHITGC